MSESNRWVKLSRIIPWDELAAIYYKSMNVRRGAPTVDARIVLGSLIIKHMMTLDDRGTIEMIQENPYMQYFLGLAVYTAEPVFDPSLFVSIRKRIGHDSFELMNQQIINRALEATARKKPAVRKNNETEESNEPQNKGKLQMDATVTDADIKYPTDVDLLNDSREVSEKIIDELYSQLDMNQKPRTYRRKARKAFLNFSKNKKKSRKIARHAIKVQLGFLNRNIKSIEKMLDQFGDEFPLDKKTRKYYYVIQHVAQQQAEMLKESKNTCADRIVSIHQPHVRPMVRGKSGKNVEFGAKIDVSLQDGFARLERLSWNAFNEGQDLIDGVLNYKKLRGYFPDLVQVDKIYLTRENRKFLKEHNIRHTGRPLGRPIEQEQTYYQKRKARKEAAERNFIEGAFGVGKRKYRMNRIYARTQKTSESWIAALILVANLAKLLRVPWPFYFALQKMALKYVCMLRNLLRVPVWQKIAA